jgi:hypothetical protein
MATTNSRSSLVNIGNVSTSAATALVNAEIEVLELAGFVVTEQKTIRIPGRFEKNYVILTGVLPSLLSQSFETTEDLWIPPRDICVVGGTWTYILDAGGIPVLSRAQADATGTVTVYVSLGARAEAGFGFKLNSLELIYGIATAAADAVGELGLQTSTPPAGGVVTNAEPDLAAVATTIDGAHDTAGERLSIGVHNTIATVDAPAYTGSRVSYQADMTFDAAATTDLTLYGAIANVSRKR